MDEIAYECKSRQRSRGQKVEPLNVYARKSREVADKIGDCEVWRSQTMHMQFSVEEGEEGLRAWLCPPKIVCWCPNPFTSECDYIWR